MITDIERFISDVDCNDAPCIAMCTNIYCPVRNKLRRKLERIGSYDTIDADVYDKVLAMIHSQPCQLRRIFALRNDMTQDDMASFCFSILWMVPRED